MSARCEKEYGPLEESRAEVLPPGGVKRRRASVPRLTAEVSSVGEAGPDAVAPHILIVGGGGTGGALAHDLALRGLRVTLVERGEVTSGTTGRHHGLLHSGARYATTDRAAAIECIAENKILRRICPGSFEENDGLFVAITDEDVEFEESIPRIVLAVRRADQAHRPGASVTHGARPQPQPSLRDPGSRRHDGRNAGAAAFLRDGPSQRRGHSPVHGGRRRNDGRPNSHRGEGR